MKKYKIYDQNGQWRLTINKVVAQSIGLRCGDEIEFRIDRGELIIRKV